MSENGRSPRGASFCDLEFLLVNLGRNQETADRLIRLFLANAPVLRQRLSDAARAGDLPALKDTLHDIRSSCVLFSGHQCVDRARDIELVVREHLARAPRDSQAVDWHGMSLPLHASIACMVDELESYLADRPG